MGAGASAQPLVPPPTEPKETADKNDDSLTSVPDARLAARAARRRDPKLTYSDSAFEARLTRNLPSPLEWPPASETRRRRKTLDRLQELFGKASLSSRQSGTDRGPAHARRRRAGRRRRVPDGARRRASARPALGQAALSRCEPPLAADLLERLGARATREAQDAAIEAVSRGPAPREAGDAPVATRRRKRARRRGIPTSRLRFHGCSVTPATTTRAEVGLREGGWIPDNGGKHGAPPSPLEHIIDADVADRRSQGSLHCPKTSNAHQYVSLDHDGPPTRSPCPVYARAPDATRASLR